MTKLDPVKITSDLIKCKSIAPEDGGAIQLIKELLLNEGFKCQSIPRNEIQNLFARWGDAKDGLTFCFNGHIDVVPPGPIETWSNDPFHALERDGFLFGRGAADMKSAVAAFIAASVEYINENEAKGSIVIAITGDEEGEAKDGTLAILDWIKESNEKIDHCLIGEPTSRRLLGDTIKIGRRGSLTAKITASGLQGHVAYPEEALNPLPVLMKLLTKLEEKVLDNGSKFFDPSSLVLTTIDTDNPSSNVIPQSAEASLNIRFNDLHSDLSLASWIKSCIKKVNEETGVNIKLDLKVSAKPFVCEPGNFVNIVSETIESQTNLLPSLSTSGGTSDARFIQKLCPVVEFGLVGKTMHKTDENVEIKQIKDLSKIYKNILESYFNKRELEN